MKSGDKELVCVSLSELVMVAIAVTHSAKAQLISYSSVISNNAKINFCIIDTDDLYKDYGELTGNFKIEQISLFHSLDQSKWQ